MSALRLKLCNGPFLLLVKIKEASSRKGIDVRFTKGVGSQTESATVYGAYSNSSVKDTGKYFGDENCFIFGLMPVCRIYKQHEDKQHEGKPLPRSATRDNYVYFNSRLDDSDPSRPVGLGFGGRSPNHCRIWIDFDMKEKSYTSAGDDDTYFNGELTSGQYDQNVLGYSSRPEILAIEVWTFGDEKRRQAFSAAASK